MSTGAQAASVASWYNCKANSKSSHTGIRVGFSESAVRFLGYAKVHSRCFVQKTLFLASRAVKNGDTTIADQKS